MAEPKTAQPVDEPQTVAPVQQPLHTTPQQRDMWRGLAMLHDFFDEWEAERQGKLGWIGVVLVTLLVALATWFVALALGWGSRHY